jgi:hypothetical protein
LAEPMILGVPAAHDGHEFRIEPARRFRLIAEPVEYAPP